MVVYRKKQYLVVVFLQSNQYFLYMSDTIMFRFFQRQKYLKEYVALAMIINAYLFLNLTDVSSPLAVGVDTRCGYGD